MLLGRSSPLRISNGVTATLEELFARYQRDRDPSALAAVYDRTAHELYRIALHLAGNPADAEELLQSTFLAAIDAAPRYSQQRRLMPWLIGILRRQAGLMSRSAARQPAPDRLPHPVSDDPASAAARVEFTESLDTAIADVPRALQPVLVLRLKHGLAPGEIAHALQRPPSTVRTQLSRGLDRLRSLLPPGLSLVALGLIGRRGLAAVRKHVLTAAANLPIALSAVSGAVAKKLLITCGAIAVVATATLPFFKSEPANAPEGGSNVEAASVEADAATQQSERRVAQESKAAAVVSPASDFVVHVVDEDGKPVAGVPVLVRKPAKREQLASGKSDARGQLSVSLPKGFVEVVANAKRKARPTFDEASGVARLPDMSSLRLVLVERSGSLRVNVSDDLLNPVQGVKVSIQRVFGDAKSPETAKPQRLVPDQMPTCLRAKIKGELPSGVTCASCHAPPKRLASAPAQLQRRAVEDALKEASLKLVEEQRRMELDLNLQMLVADNPEAMKAHAKQLEVRRSRQSRRSDEHGVVLFKELPAGDYLVSLSGRANLRVAIKDNTSQRARVERRQETTLAFRLQRCGKIAMSFYHEISPSTASVRLTAIESVFDVKNASLRVRDDEERELYVPPGLYAVDCDVPAGLPVIATIASQITVVSGETTKLPVRLTSAEGTLSGRVIDAKGVGVSGVEVRASVRGHPGKRARTRSKGEFVIRGLPKRTLSIEIDPTRAIRPGIFAIPTKTVLAKPGRDAVFTLEPGFELYVTIRDPQGAADRGSVTLTPGPRGPSARRVVRKGRAVFRPLRPGLFRVAVFDEARKELASREVRVDKLPKLGRHEVVITLPGK